MLVHVVQQRNTNNAVGSKMYFKVLLAILFNVSLLKSTFTPIIRYLEEKDWEEYKALRLAATQEAPYLFARSLVEEEKRPIEEWKKKLLLPVVQECDSFTLGAFNGATLIGAARVRFGKKDNTLHTATLSFIYVHPEWRRMGVAKNLMEAVLDRAPLFRKGLKKMSLYVGLHQEKAKSLYRNFKFEETGKLQVELCIEGKYYDLLLMEKILSLE